MEENFEVRILKLPPIIDLRDFKKLSKKSTKGTLTEKDYIYWLKATGRKIEYEIIKKKKIKVIEGYLYIIKSGEYYKIGKALKPKQRIKTYITENPNKITVILCEKVKDYTKTEKELHSKFKDKNHNREWFNLDDKDINLIKDYIEWRKA